MILLREAHVAVSCSVILEQICDLCVMFLVYSSQQNLQNNMDVNYMIQPLLLLPETHVCFVTGLVMVVWVSYGTVHRLAALSCYGH